MLSFVLAAIATALQYSLGLKKAWLGYSDSDYFIPKAMGFYGIPLLVFLLVWMIINRKKMKWFSGLFAVLFLLTLYSFALRIGFTKHNSWVYQNFDNWDYGIRLSNAVLLGPLMCILPVLWWWIIDRKAESRLYGLKATGVNWKAYLTLLVLMLPLITLASTQKDFTTYYPRVARIFSETFPVEPLKVFIYELAYGFDFVYVEFFFRGFLVIAFSRFLGPVSIPFAALMYCTIHFGKPLGETISSWFGGMLLGILVYETRSIFGGIVVHVGIAWLMELGGAIGRWFESNS